MEYNAIKGAKKLFLKFALDYIEINNNNIENKLFKISKLLKKFKYEFFF